MPYNNRLMVEKLQNHKWIYYSEFLHHVGSLKYHKILGEKNQIQEKKKNLESKAPFGVNKRFPLDLFIDLDLKGNAAMVKEFYDAVDDHNGVVGHCTVDDWLDKLKGMPEEKMYGDGVFVRDTFEEYFGLTWTQDSEAKTTRGKEQNG